MLSISVADKLVILVGRSIACAAKTHLFIVVFEMIVSGAAVQAGGRIHDLPETTSQPATANHRLLRASVPGKDVRRSQYTRRAQRMSERG